MVTQTWTAPARGRVTVADWAARWLDFRTGIKPSTLYRYGTLLRAHVLPAWGDYRLADVIHADVATWVRAALDPRFRSGHRPPGPSGLSLCCSTSPYATGGSHAIPLSGSRSPASFAGSHASSPGQRSKARRRRGRRRILHPSPGLHGTALRRVGRTPGAARRLPAIGLIVAESATEVGGKLLFGAPKTHQQRSVPLPAVLADALPRRCEGEAA
jgi:hypothetical protein